MTFGFREQSPNALEVARTPSTRYKENRFITFPPTSSILFLSSSSPGLWSFERGKVENFPSFRFPKTALESPYLIEFSMKYFLPVFATRRWSWSPSR